MDQKKLQYIAAAVAWQFSGLEQAASRELGTSIVRFKQKFDSTFKTKISDDLFIAALNMLAREKFVDILHDEYAGYVIFFDARRWSDRYTNKVVNSKPLYFEDKFAAVDFFMRVFQNEQFWSGILSDVDAEDGPPVPAADRIVQINDNQREEIDKISQSLLQNVEAENAIDGDIDVRDRFIAQIKAGRELFQAQSVRAYLVFETFVAMLNKLIDTYKSAAIGEIAKKLLDVLIEHILGK